MKTEIPHSRLETRHLTVGFRAKGNDRVLFEDLSLALMPGRLVCFMGPNGIGKSSLIRTLAGLQKQLGGEVILHQHQDPQPHGREKQIAVVLTDRITSANMTVHDVVAYGRYPYLGWSISLRDSDREIIARSLRMAHIGELAEEKIHSLSDGQLQMVMIARALAQDTPVILLDEPTAHLDLNNRVEIMKLLKRLAAETNKSILVATHELDLALQMADLIWLTGLEKNMLTGIPEDLVLNGSFDSIFQFKGFDLKTGKVQHAIVRDQAIALTGDGYAYLWTKNALERNGFGVVDHGGGRKISIHGAHDQRRWVLEQPGHPRVFRSIEELIKFL